jgi:hypothetical protein
MCTSAADKAALPDPANLELYLLMGQSNMAGRGKVEDQDRTPHPRVIVFTLSNQWEVAVEPITRDKPKLLGVGPGLAFGKAMAEAHPQMTIGLVPCAVGGTPLSRWQKGGDLYSNAVVRAKLAMQVGTIKGVLWHQGESDSGTQKNAESYGQRLGQMIRDLRRDLGTPDLPFIAGQLGEYLYDRSTNKPAFHRVVNTAIEQLPKQVPASGYVPSKGLNHKGDVLHFDAASQRELGKRYAAEMLRVQAGKAAH